MKYFTGSAGVTVNGTDLSRFSAKLSAKYTISGAEISYNTMQGKNRTFFESLGSRFGMNEITLPIDFETESRAQTTLCVSQLNAAFNGVEYGESSDIIVRYRNAPVVIDLGDGFMYRAVCTSCGAPAWINDCMCSVDYTFTGTRVQSLQSGSIRTGSAYIDCAGTYPRNDCRIKIDIYSARIQQLTADSGIWLLTSIGNYDATESGNYSRVGTNWQARTWFPKNTAADQHIIYDGISKSMTLNGSTRGPDRMVWTDYPWLSPGTNGPWCYYSATGEPDTWQVATSYVYNTVEWYPTFL